LIRERKATDVVFAYSDVSYEYVMHVSSGVLAAGANFTLLGPEATMLQARLPVVAICAVRTGCGKSQTTRYIAELWKREGLRVVAVRHPMPYGDLAAEAVQWFAELGDLDATNVTVEEREEYEAHI
jgi:predicted GTPase